MDYSALTDAEIIDCLWDAEATDSASDDLQAEAEKRDLIVHTS